MPRFWDSYLPYSSISEAHPLPQRSLGSHRPFGAANSKYATGTREPCEASCPMGVVRVVAQMCVTLAAYIFHPFSCQHRCYPYGSNRKAAVAGTTLRIIQTAWIMAAQLPSTSPRGQHLFSTRDLKIIVNFCYPKS